MIKKIRFIINPISGTKNKDGIIALIPEFMNPERFEYDIRFTEHSGHAAEIAKEAITEGINVVVAVGGDGTVNETARALIGSNTALGIIPCGSGNGLARHLHLPMSASGALKILSECNIHNLDYGTINNRPFFCTAGVGFDASLSDHFAKAGRRGLATYVENALKVGLSYKSETYDLRIEGMNGEDGVTNMKIKAFLITCANASQYGNDFWIAPHASMQDGLMDVTILEPFSILESSRIAYQMVHKTIHHNPYCKSFKCKAMTIHRTEPGVIHYDGDPVEECADVDVRIVPHQINMVVNLRKHTPRVKHDLPSEILSLLKVKK